MKNKKCCNCGSEGSVPLCIRCPDCRTPKDLLLHDNSQKLLNYLKIVLGYEFLLEHEGTPHVCASITRLRNRADNLINEIERK